MDTTPTTYGPTSTDGSASYRILLLGLMALMPSAFAHAQGDCSATIAQANADFASGVHPLNYAALERCAAEADVAAVAVLAYRVAALSRHHEGDTAEAKQALVQLLARAPTYEPDRTFDPPAFVAFVADTKRELRLPSPYHCDRELFDAQQRFDAGAFNEAALLLSACTNRSDLVLPEAIAVFRLLAMAHHRNGAEAEAKLALVRLLGLDPGYEPDGALDSPSFAVLLADVRRELQLSPSTPCYRELIEAEALYVEEAYAEVVGLLQECLAKPSLPPSEAVLAYRLIVLSHLKAGDLAAAHESAAALLGVAPDYEADPVQDLPPFVSLLNIVRAQVEDGI